MNYSEKTKEIHLYFVLQNLHHIIVKKKLDLAFFPISLTNTS